MFSLELAHYDYTSTPCASGFIGVDPFTTAPPPPAPRARIVEVTVSALSVTAGQPVSICYTVENSTGVRIEPIHFDGGAKPSNCALDQPRQTTTYIVTAKGASSQDTEKVTVAVQ